MKRLRGWPTYLGLLVVVFAFAASMAWGLYRLASQEDVIHASETTGSWLVVQAEHELMKFSGALARFGNGDAEVAREDVIRALDLFWSRLPLLLSGEESAELRRAKPEVAERVGAMIAALEAIEPRLRSLAPGDYRAYRAIGREIAWFHPYFRDLTREAILVVQVDHTRSRIHGASLGLVAPFAGILLSGTLLVGFLVHQMNAARRESEERRRAEEAHRRVASGLAHAQRMARLGFWERDLRTGRVEWSDEHYRIFGYEPGAIEVTFDVVLDHVHPEDRGIIETSAQRTIEAGDSASFEYRILRRDGGVRHVVILTEIVRDGDGRPIKLTGTAQDITERKRAERQNALLGVFLDNVGDAVEITDAEDRIEYVNPAHERITGYSAAEAIGKTPAELHRPLDCDPEVYDGIGQTTSAGNVWKGRIEGRRKDGSTWFQEATVSPVVNDKGEITHYIGIKRDVSEHIRAEEALRLSEQRFRDIAEASSDWFWEMDENLRFTSFSDRVRSVSGRYPHHLIGKTRWEGAGADLDDPKWRAHIADLEARRPFRDFRYEYVTSDGSRVHLVASGKPILDERGAFKGYRGTSNNVTERVRAEEELRRQALILDQMSDGVIVTALDRTIVDANKGAERIFGYARAELIGRSPAILHAPAFCDAQRAAIAEGLASRDGWAGEIRIRRKDGSDGVSETTIVPFRNERGEVVAHIAVNRDVTERKRAEEGLRASEERFRGAFVNSVVAMGLVDLDGRFLQVNPSFCEMLGYAEAELLAMNRLDITHPDDREKTRRLLERMLAGEVETGRMEKRYLRKDGRMVWGDMGISLVRDAAGRPRYAIGMIVDVTERKAAEEALRRAKEEAELANRVKTEFLANMSHELRTPLNSIIGFSDVLRNESFGPIGAAKYREYADDINAAGRHLLELINDILELARIDIAEVALDEEDIDVVKTLDACRRMISDRALRADVSLSLEAPGDMPRLHADQTRFRQIVLNLLSNAVKFTGAGGHVRMSAALDDLGAVVIDVADSGIGIAADDIPKVLTRFGRVEGTETRNYEGSGLGLTMVQSLAELHDASFTLDSALGRGTRARVRFPPERTVRAAPLTLPSPPLGVGGVPHAPSGGRGLGRLRRGQKAEP